MEFAWTDEQRELRSSVRRLLADRAPVSRARALAEAGERYDPALWTELADGMGLPGIAIPEEYGGSGGSWVDLAVVVEEMGAVLLGGPFLPTAVLAAEALLAAGDEAAKAEYLPQLADGSLTGTVAVAEAAGRWDSASIATTATGRNGGTRLTGVKDVVLDGGDADLIIVAARSDAGVSLYLVAAEADGVTREPLDGLDLTRTMSRLVLRDASARLLGTDGAGWAAVEHVIDAGCVHLAAEQVGGSAACVALTAEYARTRRQFGRAIGSFQGVKHRLADMQVRLELARSAAYWAAWQVPGSDSGRLGAAVARSYCSESFFQTARDTISLHGGIGFTWEHDAHLFARRARADYSLVGDPAAHRARLAGLLAPGAQSTVTRQQRTELVEAAS